METCSDEVVNRRLIRAAAWMLRVANRPGAGCGCVGKLRGNQAGLRG